MLSQARNTPILGAGGVPVKTSYPVAANAILYPGALIALNAGGYAVPASADNTLKVVGIADPTWGFPVDNTGGGNGAVNVACVQGVGCFTNGNAASQAAVGGLAYAVDDGTVSTSSAGSTRPIAGSIFLVDESGIWIYVGIAPAVDATALNAFIGNVASVGAGEGASLVGVQDAAGLYAGTTVEAALAELIGGARVATVVDNQLAPGVPLVLEFAVPDAASGHTDYVIAEKIEITDVIARKDTADGGAGDTVQLQTGAGVAISDAMSLNHTTKALVRAATLDGAHTVIAAAGTLRITWVKATNVACQLTIPCIRRA